MLLCIKPHNRPTHRAIHVVLATSGIIFFILFSMPGPASTTERMFAFIHHHGTFVFRAISINPSIFPRSGALIPVINKHIVVTNGTVIGLGLRLTQFANRGKPGPSVSEGTHSPVFRKRHRNGAQQILAIVLVPHMVVWPSGFLVHRIVSGDISQFVDGERIEIGTYWPHHAIRHTVNVVSPPIHITVTGPGRVRRAITEETAISRIRRHTHSLIRTNGLNIRSHIHSLIRII